MNRPRSGSPIGPAPWGMAGVILSLIAAVVAFLMIVITAGIFTHARDVRGVPPSELGTGLAATFVFELCLFGIAMALGPGRYRMSLREYGFRSFAARDWYLAPVAILGTFVILEAYVALVMVLHLLRLVPTPNLPSGIFQSKNLIVPAALEACLVAPLVEESFFRGFLMRGLLGWPLPFHLPGLGRQPRVGFWAAAILSGLLFAAFHGEIELIIPFTGVGALFAWLFWRSGSLWPNILAHAGFNALSFALTLLHH